MSVLTADEPVSPAVPAEGSLSISDLGHFAEVLPDAILGLDLRGCIRTANRQTEALLGWSHQDLMGRDFAGTALPPTYRPMIARGLHPETRPDADPLLGRRIELRVVKRDGTLIPVEMTLTRLAIASDEFLCVHLRDLTAQRQLESILCGLSARDALILNSAGEGIFGLDGAGRVTFMNPAAERMLGAASGQLLGKEQSVAIPYLQPNREVAAWEASPMRASLEKGIAIRVSEGGFQRVDGSTFQVEFVSTPMIEADGIGGTVIVFRDLTEQRRLETELVQARKLEAIGSLAAGIAHEINTPIQFVGDNLHFLRDGFDTIRVALERSGAAASDADLAGLIAEIPEALNQSLEGADRVARIVRAMKEFSHPGPAEKSPVDLNRAIESTVTVSRNEWKYVAELKTDFDPLLPPVPCLAGEFNQVILNMLVNAAHAIADVVGTTGGKGLIGVSTRTAGNHVEIRISDSGTGIHEDVRGKIFDPFFTTKAVGKGTGQGLAIARAVIVEKHGGAISVESEVGHGATFVIRLPLQDGDPQAVLDAS